MRTTVAVDDNLLLAARRRAQECGQTLGQVVEGALRRELAEPARVEPGVDLTSNRALRARLDEGIELDSLR
jgi:hypothetical protein